MLPAEGKTVTHRILNVDDYAPGLYSKSRILRKAGFEVEEASTGRQALERAGAGNLDLILLDVNLPDISGLEVCRRIKSDEATSNLLVLQISASFATTEDRIRGLDNGADGYLTEPLEPAVLIATVNSLARLRQAERELTQAKEALAEQVRQTERLYREAQEANRSKDHFLAVLSHEMRTPLNSMLGWARLLQSGQLDAAATVRALASIERNTRLQAQLIDDLLDVARIAAGKLRIERQDVDMVEVVQLAADAVRAEATARSVRLQITADQRLPDVTGDPGRLQQVMWNLLNNGIKFSEEGGTIRVRLQASRGQVQVVVCDDGRGIRAALLPHIFDQFRQSEAETRPMTGLGLGLAIVRQLVDLHGGTVTAESAGEGQGACFTVTLPAAPTMLDVGAETAGSTAPHQAGASLAGLRVLIVDDDPDARELVTIILEQRSARVTAVASAEQALEASRVALPHVLLSDIGMPGEDGFSLIRRFRQLAEARGVFVPAAALTAFVREEEKQRALAAGYQMHISKPIEPERLAEAVAQLARSAPISPADRP